ncbi:DUF952 domain-containing protein [Amphiplicatus metriothermophilus]|uniref:Uncharacterized conserved protein, DUF952 family n=1 Tax=Amphiplicatus metriothermophilus TaxID=1519374 RepID=A0A239PM15_9PROT|nr:DUF952 domain-containing protein [Amphiplicatus metriothermophilus]MBB5517261.1 uncharacterized protein (DUF952 family) [Amphiplicatus metriothermophilus]SNT68403.1 Uncharacterized conserved protein, DUF952 family [Amphiplicatus metriothermophilus]
MTETASTVLYRLIAAEDWATAQDSGEVPWNADDRRDGFLHLSTEAQALETARRHYAHVENLLALEVDADRLAHPLRWELAPKRGEKFPHLYGPLPVAAVRRVRRLARDAEGGFRFADEGSGR